MPFTMATWNVLATAYIRREYYPNTPPEVLDAVWRTPAMVRFAKSLGVDVLCLQEVEREVFAALEAGLGEMGYEGRYVLKGGKRPDGCAAFFRKDRFNLVSAQRFAYLDGDGGGGASGHIVQLLIVEDGGRRLALLNTHLKWDAPGTPRERQWGYRQASQALDVLRQEADGVDGEIICGDLNVTPESDVVAALLAAGFNYAHRGCDGVRTCNSSREAKLIDYLFYRGLLRSRPVLPDPIDEDTVLPSLEMPSDHLPLVARFDWTRAGVVS